MHLTLIVYVSQMQRSVRFYEAIGLERDAPDRVDEWWNTLSTPGATVALHHNGGEALPPVTRRADLNFDLPADGSLDRLLATCEEIGIEVGAGIDNIGFGRFFRVRDPDGLPVQFNERGS